MARNGIVAARARRALPAAALVLGGLLFGASSDALAQGREEFRRGIDLFEQGKFAEARDELEKVLAANPGAEIALEMRNEAGYQVFVEMLARRDDIATIARKILEMAEKGEAKDRQDPEKIQQLIAAMFGEDEETSYRAVEELASRVGPFVVPFMVDHLAERRDNDKRVKAIVLLSKLGPDGTNAVLEILKHKDDFVRQNACAILGHIRDFKAIPYLKAVSERKGESAHVTKEALVALKNITGKDGGSLDSATAYFNALAERYYQEDPSVTINNFKEWSCWEWKEEKLNYRVVPRWSWNDEMAQDVCYEAIEHGQGAEADLDQTYTILVDVFFQRHVEASELLAVGEEKVAAGGVDPAEVEALKGAQAKTAALPVLATARGEAQLLKGLRKALRDRRISVAIAIINTLRDIGMSESQLPADGANLATYLQEGGPAPKAMEAAPPRPLEPARSETGTPAPRPEPAPAPRPAPKAEEPKPEPKPEEKKTEEPPPSGSRRRRVSQADLDRDAQYAALEREVAFSTIEGYLAEPETLRTLQSSGEAHGAALAAALTYDDKRIRYAAAEALLRLSPSRKFANSSKVVENLAAAVGESGSRVSLVAARDVQVRNRLMGLVRQMNHLPFAVSSLREAVVRARSSPADDAIIAHTETNVPDEPLDFTVAQLLEQIEVDYRTAGTPVIVVAPKKTMEIHEKAYADKAKGVLPDDVDAVLLKDKLEALWTGDAANKRDPKTKAVEVAKSAAEALAHASATSPVFDLKAAIPALTACLEIQPDAVRIPALHAIGNIRAPEAADKVAAVFDNPQNSKELRVAAAFALGESCRGRPAPGKVYDGLKAALKEGDAGLFKACSEALGKMALSREQTREVLIEQRVD